MDNIKLCPQHHYDCNQATQNCSTGEKDPCTCGLDESEKDQERLDWLERSGAWVEHHIDAGTATHDWWKVDCGVKLDGSPIHYAARSLRSAIDAARTTSPTTPGRLGSA